MQNKEIQWNPSITDTLGTQNFVNLKHPLMGVVICDIT